MTPHTNTDADGRNRPTDPRTRGDAHDLHAPVAASDTGSLSAGQPGLRRGRAAIDRLRSAIRAIGPSIRALPPSPSALARALGVRLIAATAGLLGLWAVVFAGAAAADLPSNCSQSGSTITCTYSYTGGEQTFTVPTGISSLDVTAVGASGGASANGDAGGPGASVEDTAVPVTAGDALPVIVGGVGGDGVLHNGGAGGTPGGGGPGGDYPSGNADADFDGGGGGGYSGLLASSNSPLVIAAGGGGGGFLNQGGAGDTGNGGASGTGGSCIGACGDIFGGAGGGGTSTAGGGGGAGANAAGAGANGSSQNGGQGGASNGYGNSGGGGGGGGYYGGGGGGGGGASAGGGGGGSSYPITGLTNEATASAAASVTVSYRLPDTTPPTDNPTVTGTIGNNGWYTSNVTVAWNWTDSGWGVDPGHCTQTSSSSGDGSAVTVSSTCQDLAGNTASDSRTFKVDTTPPTVSCRALVFLAGDTGTVSASVADATSGPAQPTVSAPADTTSAGVKTVSLTGEDNAGNATTVSCSFTVAYGFGGFGAPLPKSTLLRSGSTIPVKFVLTDSAGHPIGASTAAALATASTVKVTLAGPAISPQTATCTWNSTNLAFQCNIKTPSGLKTGTSNPYTITATENLGGGFITAPAVGTAINPETVYFK